jgi:hypothetical protein
MAIVLRHDGANDHLTFSGTVNVVAGDTIEVRSRILTNQTFAWISNGPSSVSAYVRWNGSTLRARGTQTGPAVSPPAGINLADGEFHTVQLILGATTHKFNVDGNDTADLSGDVSTNMFNTLSAFFNSYFDGDLEYLRIFDSVGTNKFYWDANSSTTGPGATILTETVVGNDATGVGFPTDGSQWIDIGGGISVNATLGTISLLSNNALVGLSGEIPVQATLGQISYSSNNAQISISGSIDVNATLGQIAFVSNNVTVGLESALNVNPLVGQIEYTNNNSSVILSGTIAVTATLGTIECISQPTSVRIGSQWTDKPFVTTEWSDLTPPDTIWTDK